MAKGKGTTATAPAPMDDYQAEDDARTLVRAQEVQGDRGRHSKAKKHLKKTAKNALAAAGSAPSHRYDREAVVRRKD